MKPIRRSPRPGIDMKKDPPSEVLRSQMLMMPPTMRTSPRNVKVLVVVHETPPRANTRRHVERAAGGAYHFHDSAYAHPTSLTSEADKSTRFVRRSTVKRAAVAMAEGLEKELSCSVSL